VIEGADVVQWHCEYFIKVRITYQDGLGSMSVSETWVDSNFFEMPAVGMLLSLNFGNRLIILYARIVNGFIPNV
jgi:hypothetical protein